MPPQVEPNTTGTPGGNSLRQAYMRLLESRRLLSICVALLLMLLVAEMALSVARESQTFDEGNHIFAGYMSWKTGDYGLNPEHPPLVKMLAAVPLMFMNLRVPALKDVHFKLAAFEGGRDFVSWNGPDRVLFAARMSVALLTIFLAMLVFLAAREMFGPAAGLFALTVVVFEPNLLAHGALVTTDAGVSCFLLMTVYAFYRYAKAPSIRRLMMVALSAGLALASKHTGLLVFPIMAILALYEVVWRRAGTSITRAALRYAGALAAVGIIAVGILWCFYGFRYSARPPGMTLNPPLAPGLAGPRALQVASWKLLPESYIYGLVDIRSISTNSPTYVFGKTHPRGVWFYFPVAFAVKSTAAVLVFVILALWAALSGRWKISRELVFVSVPPVFFMLVTLTAGLNIGVRHILPVYIFLAIGAGAVASVMTARSWKWAYVFAGLLAFHAVSSARAFPTYLAYANEFWGGPANTYKYLTDSNTDWGQQLPSVAKYLRERGMSQCWFGYFAGGVADTRPYGIPCKALPTISSMWVNAQDNVPPVIDGPVLVSAASLSGYETGPGPLNPYSQFQRLKPSAVIDHGVFVYEGRFEIPLASAMPHCNRAEALLAARQADAAFGEAQLAVETCPQCVRAQTILGDVLVALHRSEKGREAYQRALALAQELPPGYREPRAAELRNKLALLDQLQP